MQTQSRDETLHLVETLAVEIFSTTYGVDWSQAITLAVNSLPDLLSYAEGWDLRSDLMRLNRREIAVMRETNCTPEQAIDAVRAADGKPTWSEVVGERRAA